MLPGLWESQAHHLLLLDVAYHLMKLSLRDHHGPRHTGLSFDRVRYVEERRRVLAHPSVTLCLHLHFFLKTMVKGHLGPPNDIIPASGELLGLLPVVLHPEGQHPPLVLSTLEGVQGGVQYHLLLVGGAVSTRAGPGRAGPSELLRGLALPTPLLDLEPDLLLPLSQF